MKGKKQMKNHEKTVKTAVIYARQSYGKEESSLSVEQQIARCVAWCKRNGVEIKGIFKDNNTSSELYPNSEKGKAYCATDIGWQRWRRTRIFKNRKAYRQGLADAFAMIEQQHIDYFVVDELTRFYRNPSSTSNLDTFCIVELQEAKTALVNVTDNKIDYLESNINIAMWRAFAQYEMEKVNEKAEASRRNRKANIQKGLVYSNAYGVDWTNKKICFNAEKSSVIRYVFEAVIKGKTYGEILYTLNTTYLHLANGKCFYESSVYNILENPIYCGFKKLEDGKFVEVINLGNKPIITFSMFKKANEIVKSKKESSGKQKYNLKDADKRHFLPFSGLLKCGNCGSKLTMGLDRGIIYYCKNTHLKHDKGCTSSRIRFDWDMDENDFLLVFQPLFLLRLQADILEYRKISNANDEKEKLEMEISNLKSKMKVIMDSFLHANLDEEIFKSTIDDCKKQLIEKENQIITLSSIADAESEKEIERFGKLQRQIEDSESLIDNDDYARLLRDTIKEVKVFQDEIQVILFDGNTFSLPRLKANRRSKKLPNVSARTTFIPIDKKKKEKGGYLHYTITFSSDDPTESITLLETPYYKIILNK